MPLAQSSYNCLSQYKTLEVVTLSVKWCAQSTDRNMRKVANMHIPT